MVTLPLHSFTLTIFIILLTLSTSNGVDNRYKECSSSIMSSCGNLQNVGYPFWGNSWRPQYCGHPALELQCQEYQGTRYPVLNIGDDDRVRYYVNNISNYFSEIIIQLHELPVSPETCPFRFHKLDNRVFPEIFRMSENVVNITLYRDCPDKHMREPDVLNCNITCFNSENTTYYLNHSTSAAKRLEHCQRDEVPVLKSKFDLINQENFHDVLFQGFEVVYLQSLACSSCKHTGGMCGSKNTDFQCHNRTPVSTAEKRKIIFESVVLGAFFTPIVLGVGFWCCLKQKFYKPIQSSRLLLWKNKENKCKSIETFLKIYGSLAPRRYTFTDIRNMTNSFSERLGEGGFATVYKGNLSNGRLVAVKLLKESKGTGEDFINEVTSICRTNHVNIVALFGFCYEGKKRALIYDFMSNGSLEKFVYHGAREQALSWETLFSIGLGIARGLDYLHRGCNARVLHFDIKPHNILLDEDFCPKISDFGLARLCPQKESTISMLDTRGTIGYIAPEVFCRTIGGVSHKSDVYSYGMMILDIVCGRKNINSAESQHSSDLYFPQWIYKRLQHEEEVAIHGIMNEEEKAIEKKMILVSLWCIQTYPSNRPSMSRVIEMLQGDLASIQMPPAPQLSSPPRAAYSSLETVSLTVT